MKVGIKVYSDNPKKLEHALAAEEFADFIEIMAVPGTDIKPFKVLKKPIVIHAPHEKFKCNPADRSFIVENLECLTFAVKTANILNAKVIVVHPGNIYSPSCSVQNSIDAIRVTYDRRMVLENLFENKGDTRSICSTAEEMHLLMDATGAGLCLDFSHACAAAKIAGEDAKNFVKRLAELKPKHYHIAGGKLESGVDLHWSLFDGNLPTDYFKSLMPDDAWVTLETPQDIKVQKREYEFMKR